MRFLSKVLWPLQVLTFLLIIGGLIGYAPLARAYAEGRRQVGVPARRDHVGEVRALLLPGVGATAEFVHDEHGGERVWPTVVREIRALAG